MGEETGLEFSFTKKSLLTLSILLNILFIILFVHDLSRIDDIDRIERVESLMWSREISFHGILLTENSTFAQARSTYFYHTAYSQIFADMALEYVCDGKNDIIFEYIR